MVSPAHFKLNMLNIENKRKYQREWVAKRRQEFFKDKFCVKCGSTNRLELDHINPKEKVSHNIFSWSKEKQNLELAKCQVLCYLCHKIKSAAEYASITGRVKSHIHGTTTEYRNGCRCDLCKAAKYAATTEYRQRKRYARQRLEEIILEIGANPIGSTTTTENMPLSSVR